MNNNTETNVEKLPEFICQLYEMKYEPATPLKTLIKGVFTRRSKDEPREVRKAKKLQRRISAYIPLNDELPLSSDEVRQLKDVLLDFVREIVGIIGEYRNDPFSLASSTFRFAINWNKLVESLEDKFLLGYGQIKCAELIIFTSDRKNMKELFAKMRKAQRLPIPLGCFHSKINQSAIITSIDAYFKLIDWKMEISQREPHGR